MSLPTSAIPPSPRGVRRAFRWLLLAGLAVQLALLQAGSLPAQERPSPASSLERRIRLGEAHTYAFSLSSGDFLGAVIEQKDIDVVLELFDPHGKSVLQVDSTDMCWWQEEIAWVAAEPGPHRLVVTPLPESATAGAYEIRIHGPRPERMEDAMRVQAVREMQMALEAWGRHALRLQHLEAALPLWRTLGDRRRQAETLYQLGITLGELDRNADAAERFHQSLALWKELGLDDRWAFTLLESGRMDQTLFREEEGRRHQEESLAFARRSGHRLLEGRALYYLGHFYHDRQDLRAALDHLTAALPLTRQAGDQEIEVRVLYYLGFTYDDLAETKDAMEFYEEALDLARRRKDDTYQALTLNNLGFLYASLGQREKAIDDYQQAISLSQRIGDKIGEAAALNNLALIYEKTDPTQADRLYQRSLTLGRESGNLEIQAKAINNLAFLDLHRNDPAKALEHCREALALMSGNQAWEAPVHQAMGMAFRRMGDLERSRHELENALDLSRERADRVRESLIIPELAKTESKAGNLHRALELLNLGIELVESLRVKVVEEDLRSQFLASRQDTYELYVATLMGLHRAQPGRGYDAEALRASERARARSLLDILAEAGADVREGANPELVEQERRLGADIEALERRRLELLSKGSLRAATEVRDLLTATLARYDKVQSELRASSPRYAALTQPEPLSVAEIQSQVLDRRTLLLEYSLGEERSFLWAVTPDSLHSFELPPRSKVEDAARRYYGAVSLSPELPEGKAAQATARQAADELSAMLLKPVAHLLTGQTLLVVSDGALQYVPFGALPAPSPGAPKRMLVIERHNVVSLPSASVLAVLRRELANRAPAPKMLAVLADPVFQPEDERVVNGKKVTSLSPRRHRGLPEDLRASEIDPRKLPRLYFSKKEADDITSLVPEGQRFKALDFRASRSTAISGELSDYRMVHFATHGLVDSRRPELSSLVLSLVDERGRPQHGFLRLHEIYNLKLNADLVVLSACRTALGQEVRGEGLVGLTRGFMYAGAARVLASLWSVEDRATSDLMKRFYRHMISGQKSPAEALRRAQIEMARDPRTQSPYSWAGFSLQGEWR